MRYDYMHITTPEQAKAEAIKCRKLADYLNPPPDGQEEWAYSPSTNAVGFRWSDWAAAGWPFVICNIYYPMYGRADEVKDWISVGTSKPKRPRKTPRAPA